MALYHEFWFLREGERLYTDYNDLFARHDAPVSLHDDLLSYLHDFLLWIPTFNPAKAETGYGLNWHGPTVINQTGGLLWSQICTSWAQLFTHGPAKLILRGAYTWQWPFDESEHLVSEHQLDTLGQYEYMEIDRDWFVRMLTTLAQFGEQTATGEFFILHMGI